MDWLTTILRRPDIGWADALDIALVSFLLYELLLLIRGTRAVQMALSGGFLLVLYFLSQWLQLETVNWVIRNLAAYVVFAVIVLFQTDIRRALAHFGRAPFFRYFERAEHADETIEELVTAATNLAATAGALRQRSGSALSPQPAAGRRWRRRTVSRLRRCGRATNHRPGAAGRYKGRDVVASVPVRCPGDGLHGRAATTAE